MVTPALNVSHAAVQSGVLILTGGINESVTNLELKEGELLDCLNYLELDGPYHGYISLPGYEAFNGTFFPSLVPLDVDPDTGVIDDTAREQRRSEIGPLTGSGPVRGVHMYKGLVYGARDNAAADGKEVFVESDTGWVQLSSPAGALNPGGSCDWVNENFSKYPDITEEEGAYPPAMANVECWFMADGVSEPISYDGTTVRVLNDGNLPSSDPTTPVYPEHVAAFDNRLWLSFPGGHLFYSELGHPGGWDGAKGAGSIPCGDEITDITLAPGNVLVVFMRNSTKIVYVAERPTGDYGYQLKEFSPRSGCLPNASDRMLGDVFYVDDRGPTSMSTSDQFGDFNASSITKKAQRTFLENKTKLSATVVQRELNQWRLFFNNGLGLCFTFHNKRLKGVTPFNYPNPVLCAAEGENKDGVIQMYFGSDDGFVYHMDSGTSLNGAPIPTYFVTSYYHYRTPRKLKRFMRIVFEISADQGTDFFVRTDYDYKSVDSPKNQEQSPEIKGFGGVWGIDRWHQFTYGSSYVQNPTIYIQGYGVNMSTIVRTEEKHKAPHIVHNIIADYNQLSTKM